MMNSATTVSLYRIRYRAYQKMTYPSIVYIKLQVTYDCDS